MTLLDPQDHAALERLEANPGDSFSLLRHIVSPDPESLQPLQHDLAGLLCSPQAGWVYAGVKKPEYIGAAFFDGEARMLPERLVERGISNYALAANMCGALPDSVVEQLTATVDKVSSNHSKHLRSFLWLGLLTATGLEEARIADETLYGMYGARKLLPSVRVPVRLMYAVKEKGQHVPLPDMMERTKQAVPEGSSVTLGRLRLVVHPKGESPYDQLQK